MGRPAAFCAAGRGVRPVDGVAVGQRQGGLVHAGHARVRQRQFGEIIVLHPLLRVLESVAHLQQHHGDLADSEQVLGAAAAAVDVLVDFSLASAFDAVVDAAQQTATPLVSGKPYQSRAASSMPLGFIEIPMNPRRTSPVWR